MFIQKTSLTKFCTRRACFTEQGMKIWRILMLFFSCIICTYILFFVKHFPKVCEQYKGLQPTTLKPPLSMQNSNWRFFVIIGNYVSHENLFKLRSIFSKLCGMHSKILFSINTTITTTDRPTDPILIIFHPLIVYARSQGFSTSAFCIYSQYTTPNT